MMWQDAPSDLTSARPNKVCTSHFGTSLISPANGSRNLVTDCVQHNAGDVRLKFDLLLAFDAPFRVLDIDSSLSDPL